jgi:DNA-directed RNA polymerase subunit RPC12/RpoP
MTIDFTCQKCEGTFEIETQDLIDGNEIIECPHCGVKVSKALNEDFSNALGELRAQMLLVGKKFSLAMDFETEDLSDDEGDDDDDVEEDDDEDLDDDDEDGDDDEEDFSDEDDD